MIAPQVHIVLNEREPHKIKAAEQLQGALQSRNITSSRIPVTERITPVLMAAKPKILVLDYLLGDFSTGLDIVAAFQELDEIERPAIYFLTDEPSIRVAVEALKSGVKDYLELEQAEAINSLVEQITRQTQRQEWRPPPAKKLLTLDDLACQAPLTRSLLTKARMICAKRAPVTVLCGAPGSGRRTLAHAMQVARRSNSTCKTIDLAMYDEPYEALWGTRRLRLGENLSLIVLEGDSDEGELLEAVAGRCPLLWPSDCPKDSFLTVCVSAGDMAQAWGRLAGAEVLQVPPLNERREDIPVLIRSVLQEAEHLIGKRVHMIDADTLCFLAEQEWPGHVAQLRTVVLNAVLSGAAPDATLLSKAIAETSASWTAGPEIVDVDRLEAAAVVASSQHSLRIAAARLGVSVKALRKVIGNMPISVEEQ